MILFRLYLGLKRPNIIKAAKINWLHNFYKYLANPAKKAIKNIIPITNPTIENTNPVTVIPLDIRLFFILEEL